MSLTYSTFYSQAATIIEVSSGDTNLATVMPGCIDYAEQRLYRELDLLATRVTDTSTPLSSGNRQFTLPTGLGTFLVVEGFNVLSPSGTSSATGTRNPLTFVSREFLDATYPSNVTVTGLPEFVAMMDNKNVIVGPAPDLPYTAEVIGTQRPTPLSSNNTTTILTTMLPDLFMAASLIYLSGYQRDFGAQSDNPQMAQSWSGQYDRLIQSAQVEEVRKMYRSQAWTAMAPSPVASPPRV